MSCAGAWAKAGAIIIAPEKQGKAWLTIALCYLVAFLVHEITLFLSLLPALLGVFGDNLDRFRVRRARLDHGGGHVSGWHRWTRHVQRRPWPYLVAAVAVLVVMAIPLLDLRLGTADDGSAAVTSGAAGSVILTATAAQTAQWQADWETSPPQAVGDLWVTDDTGTPHCLCDLVLALLPRTTRED